MAEPPKQFKCKVEPFRDYGYTWTVTHVTSGVAESGITRSRNRAIKNAHKTVKKWEWEDQLNLLEWQE